jgi:two-component system chemotaxis response regulator CheB
VLVVDDSAFMRQVIAELVAACPGFTVVGTARDGEDALAKLHALEPDVVTLDVEMPGIDGLAVLGYVMSEAPRPVVMLSAVSDDASTLRALELGAVDFVRKPSGPISLDLPRVRERLHAALRAAACTNVAATRVLARPAAAGPQAEPRAGAHAAAVVLLAASTGGPNALVQLVPRLPAPLGAAVLVAQHMPPGFTASLARRLDALSPLRVVEAESGMPVRAEHVYLAPGGAHLRVGRDAAGAPVCLVDASAAGEGSGPRPSADLLFKSAAATFGAACVGVVLTGMGRDGSRGLAAVWEVGGHALVQAPDGAVVPGMPEAALARVAAAEVRTLEALADAVPRAVARVTPALR